MCVYQGQVVVLEWQSAQETRRISLTSAGTETSAQIDCAGSVAGLSRSGRKNCMAMKMAKTKITISLACFFMAERLRDGGRLR